LALRTGGNTPRPMFVWFYWWPLLLSLALSVVLTIVANKVI
jgi:hypothetical protein